MAKSLSGAGFTPRGAPALATTPLPSRPAQQPGQGAEGAGLGMAGSGERRAGQPGEVEKAESMDTDDGVGLAGLSDGEGDGGALEEQADALPEAQQPEDATAGSGVGVKEEPAGTPAVKGAVRHCGSGFAHAPTRAPTAVFPQRTRHVPHGRARGLALCPVLIEAPSLHSEGCCMKRFVALLEHAHSLCVLADDSRPCTLPRPQMGGPPSLNCLDCLNCLNCSTRAPAFLQIKN